MSLYPLVQRASPITRLPPLTGLHFVKGGQNLNAKNFGGRCIGLVWGNLTPKGGEILGMGGECPPPRTPLRHRWAWEVVVLDRFHLDLLGVQLWNTAVTLHGFCHYGFCHHPFAGHVCSVRPNVRLTTSS